MASIDYTQPLALLLRESTREAHTTVEHSPGAGLLLGGSLAKDEYVRYLMMLWHVYDAFEDALDKHATHPSLEPTYNPTLLARAPALAADISYLLQVSESSWKSHPIHTSLLTTTPPGLKAYISRIQELADASDPSPLLAHSYVRYLGDLSGGQTIRRIIAKAYELDEASGQGISFYSFKELQTSKPAGLGEMKRIKEWFREGMNAAGDRGGSDVKASVVREANTAFDLNTGLFSSIHLKEIERKKDETSTIGDDTTLEAQVAPKEKTYTFAQVIAVIAAVCLAHFLLVIGGFTGERGYQKLLAVDQWMRNMTQPAASSQ
ncbi:hypothetical protein BDQ17DRAFT_1343204 [Cyathus striatus]|nr:hypothetical protein BDQ17DRAFT_1343204 [Cyathus striatus]